MDYNFGNISSVNPETLKSATVKNNTSIEQFSNISSTEGTVESANVPVETYYFDDSSLEMLNEIKDLTNNNSNGWVGPSADDFVNDIQTKMSVDSEKKQMEKRKMLQDTPVKIQEIQ